MKTCTGCLETKNLTEFTKDRDKKDGLATRCIPCRKISRQNRKAARKITKARWEKNNPDKMEIQRKVSALKRRIKHGIGRNNILSKDPVIKKQQRLERSRYQEFWKRILNVEHKIKKNLRIRLSKALKGNMKISSAWDDTGMPMDEFKLHMSTQFSSNMTWLNYGSVWEIDHIIPFDFFDLKNPNHIKIVCHFSNLRPMFCSENRKKRNKIQDASKLLSVNVKLISNFVLPEK